jgi:hypothetical protein
LWDLIDRDTCLRVDIDTRQTAPRRCIVTDGLRGAD